MDTTRKHAPWLICVAVVMAASGCAGCPVKPDSGKGGTSPTGGGGQNPVVSAALPIGCSDPDSDCDVAQSIESGGDCLPGDCKPGGMNGKGIYNVEQGNYCFLLNGEPRFCPEAFVNTPSGVVLEARDPDAPLTLQRRNILATLDEGPQTRSVQVRAINGDRTQLTITYAYDSTGADIIAKGADLEKLTLHVDFLTVIGFSVRYDVQVVPIESDKTQKDGLQRYQVKYHQVGQPPGSWLYHCKGANEDPDKPSPDADASFLGQKRINALNAYVTSGANSTTMACEKGAIVTCMSWGYTPWNPKPGTLERSEHVFGSCLQAKRAAFFVRFGVLDTYTLNGTPIELRDQYGINDNEIDYLEAIWSPGGAECVNKENLRHMKFVNDVTALMEQHKVPACSEPPVWNQKGKLATGPMTKSVQ